jgi:hypothetical protein
LFSYFPFFQEAAEEDGKEGDDGGPIRFSSEEVDGGTTASEVTEEEVDKVSYC